MGLSSMVGSASAARDAVEDLLLPPMPSLPPVPTVPKADDPASRASYAAAQRRRNSAGASSDARGGTLLTGPLGLTDEPETRRRTILGS